LEATTEEASFIKHGEWGEKQMSKRAWWVVGLVLMGCAGKSPVVTVPMDPFVRQSSFMSQLEVPLQCKEVARGPEWVEVQQVHGGWAGERRLVPASWVEVAPCEWAPPGR